jgi:PAS domain S-box-containing protein
MKNHSRNNLYSIPLPMPEIDSFQKGRLDQTIQRPDIVRQAAVLKDQPLPVKENRADGIYETLLHQIDDLLAENMEHSNQILAAMQIDYLIMSQIFNASNDGIWALDKQRTILRVNKKLLGLLGKTIEEVIGKKCYEIFADCEAHQADEECKSSRIFSGEVLEKRQMIMFLADGRRIQVAIVSTPLAGLDGNAIGIVETFSDIDKGIKDEQNRPEAELAKF